MGVKQDVMRGTWPTSCESESWQLALMHLGAALKDRAATASHLCFIDIYGYPITSVGVMEIFYCTRRP